MEWGPLGVRKDVTPSQGCPALGITVPTTEHELVRLELDQSGHALLYLGQSEQRSNDRKLRPTSFQPPLLQCNAPELPPLTHFLNSFNGAARASLALPLASVVFLIL
ncbi:unnamed protein product [Nezara viridula]|uniref:Uncharacterized protein n=1 Tax=Nezara viridula TaxID=85310 RepID=A0A9P0H9Z4_NEZVI|nr:unnamed protein product [Nezara viridula]